MDRLREENKEIFPLKLALKKAKEEVSRARKEATLTREAMQAGLREEMRSVEKAAAAQIISVAASVDVSEATRLAAEEERVVQRETMEKERTDRIKHQSFMVRLEKARFELPPPLYPVPAGSELPFEEDDLDVSTPRSMAFRRQWRHENLEEDRVLLLRYEPHGRSSGQRGGNGVRSVSEWHMAQEQAHRERKQRLWGRERVGYV